jgi:tetratricopeptide (TPR) repeat protein
MTNSPDLRGSLRLDGHHGPASRISRTRAAELIEKAMERADTPMVPRPRSKAWSWPSRALLVPVAAAIPLALLAGAAAYFVSSHHAGFANIGAEPARQAPERAPRPSAWTESPEPSGDRLDPAPMLEKANELRAKAEWLAATELYERTAQVDPNGVEAYEAMIAAGSLRMQHLGDAKGALRLLTAAVALRPADARSKDARWERIEALRALDDRAAEKQSLAEFIGLYSEGPLPTLARERLAKLSE